MRWTDHVARMGEMRNAYKILIGKLEWMRPLVRPRRRLEDTIRKDLTEIGWEGVNWIQLSEAIVNTVMNFRVPERAVNFFAT